MKFVIETTSIYTSGDEYLNNKPVEGAELEYVDIVQIEAVTSPEEFDKRRSRSDKPWYSEGTGHCINSRGFIKRVFPKSQQRWTIDVSTIEELMKICNDSENPVIVSRGGGEYELGVIEIYDDYRE